MVSRTVAEAVSELMWTYSYYDDVLESYIEEAVEKTFDDFKKDGKTDWTIFDIHEHITENYI